MNLSSERRRGWEPGSGNPPAKILLIQFRRIGDSVLVTPALDAIRTAWPETRIHLLTESPVPDLFVGDSRVDVVWIRPSRSELPQLTADLRREIFDLVVDFQSLPLTALLARATGGFTVGFKKRARSILYHRAVDLNAHRGSDYAADHKLDLLRGLGLEPTLVLPRLVPTEEKPEPWDAGKTVPRVALMPVSPWDHKRWPASQFAETARLLHQETGAAFGLAGGPGEGDLLQEMARLLGPVPHQIFEFGTLRSLMAFLGDVDLYLGNDNGPRHIALGLGVPTVAWFGSHNPSHWTPPGTRNHPVLWNREEQAKGRTIREDLEVVMDQPQPAARVAARLLSLASRSSL